MNHGLLTPSNLQAHDQILRFPMMPVGKKFWKAFPSVHIPNQYTTEKAIDYLKRIPELRFSNKGGAPPKEGIAETREEDVDEEEPLHFPPYQKPDIKSVLESGEEGKGACILIQDHPWASFAQINSFG